MKIACIGSREISPHVAAAMAEIGGYIVSRGWWLGSGNAIGSDQAFARGANAVNPSRVILYLPWTSYEQDARHPDNKIMLREMTGWAELAETHHPGWANMTQGVKALMIRNVGIVRNADAVLAYLNHSKKGMGGTGHGWRVAQSLNIPCLDVSNPDYLAGAKAWLDTIPVK